ncbi:MAG: potassium channel protein [Ignavibacteriae bacterium]|nr:MAG: potassium channel protein [Ignavibacteriota bacterium]
MNAARNALQIIVLLLLILIAGTLGYHVIEGWTLFDSLYMTVITVATVGYGETHPLTHAGRVFTLFLILGGMGIILFGISELTQFIVQGGIGGIFRRRKMERTIKKISHHFILCGTGKSGHYVLEELLRTKRKVVAVEKDPKKVQALLDRGIPTVEGDASNDNILQSAGIDRAYGLVSTLPEDKDNLFVVITARGLNPNLRIVAKVDDVGVREKFFRSGANSAVSAPYIGGLRMASELIRPDTTTFLDSMMRDDSTLRVDEVKIGPTTAYGGKSIKTCDVLESSDIVLVSLRRGSNGQEFIFNPPPGTILNTGDTLIVIGNPEQLESLREKLSK